MPTCDPPCTNENTCVGTTCVCDNDPFGDGSACTGDQICQNGNCGMYFHTPNKSIFIHAQKIIN